MSSSAQTPQQTAHPATRWRWLAAIGLAATLIAFGGAAAAAPLGALPL